MRVQLFSGLAQKQLTAGKPAKVFACISYESSSIGSVLNAELTRSLPLPVLTRSNNNVTGWIEERRPNTVPRTFDPPISLFLPLLFREVYRGDEFHKRLWSTNVRSRLAIPSAIGPRGPNHRLSIPKAY